MLCIIASDATTAIYLAALSAICAGEFYYMLRSDAKLPNEVLGIVASASFPLAMWLFGINGVVVMVSLSSCYLCGTFSGSMRASSMLP